MSYRESPPDPCRECGTTLVLTGEITNGICVDCYENGAESIPSDRYNEDGEDDECNEVPDPINPETP